MVRLSNEPCCKLQALQAGIAENRQQPRTGGETEGQERLTSFAKSFGDPWLRGAVTHSTPPPPACLPRLTWLPLAWLPLTCWVHFLQCPAMEPCLASICQSLHVESRGTHASIPDPDWPSLAVFSDQITRGMQD